MLLPSELPLVLNDLKPVRDYSGFVWRRVDAYNFTQKGQQVFYDEGPLREGARFSPVGVARALYYAETQKTAIEESKPSGIQRFKRKPRSDFDMQVKVKLNAVLNLGNANIRRRLKTNLHELKQPWAGAYDREEQWPIPWHLGEPSHRAFSSS